MSVRLYWDYHLRDSALEAKLGSDPEEHQGVWGLIEGFIVDGRGSVSVSDMSKFILTEYPSIYARMMEIFLHRCWRFPNCYVTYAGEEFTDPTLILRRRMAHNPLPPEVRERTDAFLARNAGDKWAIVNGLSPRHFQDFSESEDYDVRVAWDLYRYQAFEEYGASILIVESSFTDARWEAIRKRVRSAERVKVEKTGECTFSAKGSSGNYDVNVETITCTCSDFRRRCRRIGMHCKHLVAALQQQGLWERYWKDDVVA